MLLRKANIGVEIKRNAENILTHRKTYQNKPYSLIMKINFLTIHIAIHLNISFYFGFGQNEAASYLIKFFRR